MADAGDEARGDRGAGLTPRVRRTRLLAVGLLMVAGVVNYFDRSAVSIANPLIRRDLHLSLGQMGLLLSVFAWAYGAAQIPAGLLVDRFGARRALGYGLVLWSAAQAASAACRSLPQLLWARAGLGLGESPMYTGGTRVCADWYRAEERSLPIAVFNSSASLGPAIAPGFLTWLMLAYGWRPAFGILAVMGVAVAAAWVLLYRRPADLSLDAGELAAIGDAAPPPVAGAHWARVAGLLRYRTCWGLVLGFFGVVYMTWLYATWLPGYLELQRHLSVKAAGLLTSIPLTAGFLGALLAGFVVNFLVRRGLSPVDACRRPVIAAMLATGVFTAAAALVGGTAASIALLSAGVFAANLASSAGWALGAVVVQPDEVASLEAVQNVGGSVGGALAPIVTGYVVMASGSFVPAFGVAAVVCGVTAAIYWLMTRGAIGVGNRAGT